MKIRQANENDAAKLAKLIEQVESESPYMLFEAGERKVSPDKQRERIVSMKEEANSFILVAETNEQLVGYLFAIGGQANRNKHTAYLVIGILNEFRGQGIGTKLFLTVEEWAVQNKLHRLELTVITENEPGVGLYQKMGFEIEGTKRHSLYIDGTYVNEYYMSKLFN